MKAIRQVPFYANHTAVALGRFDGLHLGHQSVISRALDTSRQGLTSCVFTFSRGPTDASPMLMTPALTEQILNRMGVDILLAPPFDSMKDWSPERFVSRFLHEQLGAKKVVCGFNYHFGSKASGNPDLLRELCGQYGIEVEIVGPIQECGLPISSTRIRRLVLQGDMPGAARLLGRPLIIDLPVIQGKKVGRLMGTPTINQRPPERFVIPKRGVYASCCYVGGKWLPSVTNCGLRPTINRLEHPLLETWIPNFSGDLYGLTIPVALLAFLRPEKKFDDLDQLRDCIQQNGRDAARIASQWTFDFVF